MKANDPACSQDVDGISHQLSYCCLLHDYLFSYTIDTVNFLRDLSPKLSQTQTQSRGNLYYLFSCLVSAIVSAVMKYFTFLLKL